MEENPIDARIGSSSLQRTDRPGFSLCAAPLESSGPGFRDGRVGGMNEQRSRDVLDRRWWRELVARGGVKACIIIGTE